MSAGFSSTADWQITEHLLDGLEPTVYRYRIAQALRLDVVREVQVEESGNGEAYRRFQDARRDAWITARHNLREELRFPHVRRSVSMRLVRWRRQSRTSAGWNLLPLTPNRCEIRRPRRYARRTVSSWQPMNSATSNAVNSLFGSPLPACASVGSASRDFGSMRRIRVRRLAHRFLRTTVAPNTWSTPGSRD